MEDGLEGDGKELNDDMSPRTIAFVTAILALASIVLAHVGLGIGKPRAPN